MVVGMFSLFTKNLLSCLLIDTSRMQESVFTDSFPFTILFIVALGSELVTFSARKKVTYS